jgi:beta-lactamase regulating signal transducer with metallopeptidase domain
MLAHDMAHIKRGDLLWFWLATTARLLFFFYPLVMLARRESRLTAEMAADELAVTVCRLEPADYAGGCGGQAFPPSKRGVRCWRYWITSNLEKETASYEIYSLTVP